MPPSYKFLHEVEPARPAVGDKPSASPVYRHIDSKDGFPKLDDGNTLFELFASSVKKHAGMDCLGVRGKKADGTVGEFEFETYDVVGKKVMAIAAGLRALGVEPQQRVGVFGANSPEWMMAMQATSRMSMHCVPLYDSLGENAIEFIINHSEAVLTFVSTDKFPQLVKALSKTKDTLKTVIVWGPGNEQAAKATKELGYVLHSFDELIQLGTDKPAEPVPPAPEDLCTIMYTSGTTGDPKGVQLTHAAIVGGVMTSIAFCKFNKINFVAGDRMLSYLPLAHIFDRVCEEWFLYIGAAIGYWQGDVNKLVDDIAALRPAMFIGVPRVFDRIYTRIMGQIKTAGGLKKLLFEWGVSRKTFFMKQGISHTKAAPFFDKLVFSKIAARLGGCVKAVVSGGAPLAPHVEEFLRVTMCAPVVQGYGLTETSAASFIASADNMAQAGTVGPPTPMTEFRLESVPEMNYDALSAEEPKGEVLIRGVMNFTGYYKDQKQTDEVLEADGWFHTGDIAVIQKDGAVRIIDRKKNIFKLSQGEYVAVEKLEATYKKASPLVEQVWVYGNSFKNSLIAVVVPGEQALMSWASSHGVAGSFGEVCKSDKVKTHILETLQTVGKGDKLKGFELVRAVHLDSVQFSIEEDLLTPTFKFKRPQLQKRYQKDIDALYVALKE